MPFVCTDCETASEPPSSRCNRCDGVVCYVERDEHALEQAVTGNPWEALPVVEHRITMGERETPLVRLDAVSDRLGIECYAKLESLNPTCSFKDRGSSLLASTVTDSSTSFEALVVASTGNTASSVAAYAARAGVPCAILMPKGTAAAKLSQAAEHGVSVFAVDGTFSDCFERAQAVASDRILNATAVYSANPYVMSANRTVAFELTATLEEPPAWISVPVGAGPLLGGTHAGFRELREAELIDAIPKQLCVQAQGCHPIVEAYERDRPVESWERPISTNVGAIADPLTGYAADGEHTRQAVIESDGTAIALEDETIVEWQAFLAENEGVYAEPASAASVAAIAESPEVKPGSTAVALVTGHGLKEPDGTDDPAPEVGTTDTIRKSLLE
jgi:threonine synthase